jgi:hypothetical protein
MLEIITKRLKRWKAHAESLRTNLQGRRIEGRYLIIESDDWGAIRTPSAKALTAFSQHGINFDTNLYRYDSLAAGEDLDFLFELLYKFKDRDGRPLKITANVIVANPDFPAIQKDEFNNYHYELFTETFQRYPAHQDNWEKWQEGQRLGFFQPQFHGREHLQVKRWLRALRQDTDHARYCFQYETTFSGRGDYSFMEAYDWDHPKDVIQHIEIIRDGLQQFRESFGFSTLSFIAPCYNWDSRIEPMLAEEGIEVIQSLRNQLVPTGNFGDYRPVPHYFGEKNASGLTYNIRNCFLEPSLLPSKDWVDSCLAQIQTAFRLSKPAVICSHRINYVGFISKANRDRGLKDLNQLIKEVLKRWPDVQFISTDELDRYIDD